MRQKGFAPILVILIILLVGGGVYFLSKQQSRKFFIPTSTVAPTIAAVPTVTPIYLPTPNATLDPTMAWTSFTSSKYKYSLRYPSSLFKYNKGNSYDLWVNTSEDILGENNVSLSVGMVSGPGIDSLDAYISSNPLLSSNSTKVRVDIDGVSGYKIRHIGMGGANITYTSYVIEGMVFKNGVVYKLAMASKSEDLINKYSSIFDQILSTFKFTN